MNNRFKNKVALVVGGANADEEKLLGFPGLSALLMARGGAGVVIGDIDDRAGISAVKKMCSSGLDTTYVHLDATLEEDWKSAVELIETRYGQLDILVMAAGISDPSTKIDTSSIKTWSQVMDITNMGMFLGVRSVVSLMRKSEGGSIVLISSMMAKVARERSIAYSTSRAGMTHFARSAAVQYGPDNIRVNSVLPGWTLTPSTEKMFTEEWMKRMAERIPLGRVAKANDIAECIIFLASDEARYITGTELLVDGGVTAWVGPTV